ncbi:hypothetical protein ABG79_01324 [Caloramator mitchellensis]|uniref:Small integral membrane protein (DUF2273) n=2 Tax=Caloramator mitchellensis TaxID=908809 RepID=A0A0R3JTJ1_CALMK|nr:DUF2273 domain-containing protein [Caloramator mitchellensis]KRQ86833.1 hypothetical protein ABG79_01324 [Caloramator mitchellensis]
MWKEYLINFVNQNRGKSLGCAIGLLFALFVLLIGFFKTIFILICSYIGYYIGRKIDNNEDLSEFFGNLLFSKWK